MSDGTDLTPGRPTEFLLCQTEDGRTRRSRG